MTYGATPLDGSSPQIPLGTVISPNNTGQSTGNVTPVPLQGHPGSFLDTSLNPTTAAMMGFLYPQTLQKNHAVTGSAGKTLNCSFTNANNQGNSIVVCVGLGEVENGSTITLAVTDSNSNTYTEAVKASQSTTLETAIFYATNIAPGSNTVTVTIAGGSSTNTAIAAQVYEIWGLIAQSNALDQAATGNAASGTAVSTGSITPIIPNELAFVSISAAGGTITAGTGWTLDSTSLSPTGGNLVSFGAESQQLSSIISVTPAATLSGSNAWAAACATFRSVITPVGGMFALGAILAGLSQSNRVPVSPAGQQGALSVSGSLSANSDNSLTFSGNSTQARLIRIQNESGTTIYWNTDTAASAGTPGLPAPGTNAAMVEWVNVACTTLHIFIPSGGTTTLNGSGGVKVNAWA